MLSWILCDVLQSVLVEISPESDLELVRSPNLSMRLFIASMHIPLKHLQCSSLQYAADDVHVACRHFVGHREQMHQSDQH